MAKKILIVDDDAGLLAILEKRLKSRGYDVTVAKEARTGFEKVKAESPDLIILDTMLPGMDGTTLCGVLKYDEQFKSIPVILLTVKDRDVDFKVGEMVKADCYMTKPFNSGELMDKIKELVGE